MPESLIQRDFPIPIDCVQIIESAVGNFPTPLWLSDGRSNKSLQRLQDSFSTMMRRVRDGEEVPWKELCALRMTFHGLREKFYGIDKIQVIERVIDECLERIEDVLAGSGVEREKMVVQVGRESLIFVSSEMQRVVDLARRVAREDFSVLIHGETGTGKELVAGLLHYESPNRSKQPLKAINCAALPAELLESQLFGYKKGAFTGAVRDTPGLLDAVGEGTLFLDEVGEMDIGLQAKLLRALQERRFRMVGDPNGEREFRGRVVAATNVDLEHAINSQGAFRSDLYYRLAQFTIDVPALRERRADIEVLVEFFLDKLSPKATLTRSAKRKLMDYPFPGNVRELENILKRAHILASLYDFDDEVLIDDEHVELPRLIATSNNHSADKGNAALEQQVVELAERVRSLEEALLGGVETKKGKLEAI